MTKLYTLHFREVGRGKEAFTLKFKGESMEDVPAGILREIRKRAALISGAVDIEWDEEAKTGNVVVGGFRNVGSFSIETSMEGA